MGRSVTPTFAVYLDGSTPYGWRTGQYGRPTDAALEKHVMEYAASLGSKGVNAHVSAALGYVPYPRWARVVRQATGEVVASWKAGVFQVYA